MPLTTYAHDEPGKHWIVVTPEPEFQGSRLGVPFIKGEGRTEYIEKAREFSELYNYEVTPYSGAPAWPEPAANPDIQQGVRPEWVIEGSPKTARETPLNRPEGQLKPRKVVDEMRDEKAAFGKAV